ncbi:WD40 repeat-like protein [Sodiomyces alkalinus F11]|uniref:WD40 repeat-like protein n=1 Tax=Sodiomyces alkalinus (strain CBS 110278 / VKM F-3762 / F11) TaxID=1314773 RepID=A0A3N2PZK5_SODAK|nr:WD40 repeat-like protein [Sodiomyces alkalinus F11]ROT39937.1 WD40 repeat-like protein [Sodiomyces alkalinus F11]
MPRTPTKFLGAPNNFSPAFTGSYKTLCSGDSSSWFVWVHSSITMDIHRCRFVAFPPCPINALAFSHPHTRTNLQSSLCRLAVGRANGDVEIWNPLNGAWHQETVMCGGQDRSIDGLVWVVEPDEELPTANPDAGHEKSVIPGRSRLFSIGYTSAVTEWDLEKGQPLRTASGQHGDIWCLAAQPPASAALGKGGHKASAAAAAAAAAAAQQQHLQHGPADAVTRLVAGTIDGALAIYTIADSELRFQRLLTKSPARKTQMVSIAFQSRDVVVVGCSDSTLRAYDMRNGNLLRKMTLGSDHAGGSKEIIVWSVKCLPNGDIVSGDSTGHVTVWDGKTYTQMQRIQSHRQDVLSLSASADGSAILSGGMDRRTVLHKRMAGTAGRWGKVWSRKYHDHDVKAMASFESSKMSVVVSGGPDASPVVLPLKELGRENHRTLPNLPQQPPLQSAAKARLIMSWWNQQVHIWKLRQPFDSLYDNANGNMTGEDLDKNRKLLKTILIKGESNIASASISPDGDVLAVATSTDVKAFYLKHSNPSKPSDMKVLPMVVPSAIAGVGARLVQISPDGAWLVVVQAGNKISLLRLGHGGNAGSGERILSRPQAVTRMKRKTPKNLVVGGLGTYDRTIVHVSFAPDSRMLAVADLAGYIDTWVLRNAVNEDKEGREDASGSASEESSSDSEDDDGGDDDGGADEVGSREKWFHTPASTLLPKLPSPPTVLSFSNDIPSGNASSDYTLLAVTTSWHILAFHPVEGALAPWSRRNPVARLPNTIRDTRDLAKGVLWQGARVWVYGVSFLFMLDLSQDLSEPNAGGSSSALAAQAGQKRKRRGGGGGGGGGESGAGNRMTIGAIAPAQVDRFTSDKKEWQLDVENAAPPSSEGSDTDMLDEDDEDESGDESNAEGEGGGGAGGRSAGGELAALRNRDTQMDGRSGSGRKRWWYTYKYRPILGIVPLNIPGEALDKANAGGQEAGVPPVEAVLVERPIWDVDLPERYATADEAER